MVMYGADVTEVRAFGVSMKMSADALDRIAGQLQNQMTAAGWIGPDAEAFFAAWSREHRRTLRSAADMLQAAGARLETEALDQEATSSDGGVAHYSQPGVPQPGEGDADEGVIPDWLLKMLLELGLAETVIAGILDALTDAVPISVLEDLAGILNSDLVAAFEAMSSALSLADMFVNFVTDFADNDHLPIAERVFHAAADVAIRVAVSAGAEVAGTWLGGLIGSVVFGPGTMVGALVGKAAGIAIGWGLEQGVDLLDDSTDVIDLIADKATDGFRTALDLAEIGGEVISDAIDMIDDGIEALDNLIDGGVDAIADAIGDGIDAIGSEIAGGIDVIRDDISDKWKQLGGW